MGDEELQAAAFRAAFDRRAEDEAPDPHPDLVEFCVVQEGRRALRQRRATAALGVLVLVFTLTVIAVLLS